jgi:hemerythrin
LSHNIEMKWNDKISVGIPELDEDHRQFIRCAYDLNIALAENEGKSEVKALLRLLVNHAVRHFLREQDLLVKLGFPECPEHAAKCAKLKLFLDFAMKQFENADDRISWELKALYIEGLLSQHFQKEDMRYRDFLSYQRSVAKIEDTANTYSL